MAITQYDKFVPLLFLVFLIGEQLLDGEEALAYLSSPRQHLFDQTFQYNIGAFGV